MFFSQNFSYFLASLSFFHKKRVLIGTLYLMERETRLSWICFTLSEFRLLYFAQAGSICSLTGLVSLRPYANPLELYLSSRLCLLYILKNTLSGVILKMERETRLELATPSLARKCSTTELLSHSVIIIIHGKFYFSTILFYFLQNLSHRLF